MLLKRVFPVLLVLLLAAGIAACSANDEDRPLDTAVDQSEASEAQSIDQPGTEKQPTADNDNGEHDQADDDTDPDGDAHENGDDDSKIPEYLLPKPANLNMDPQALAFTAGDPDAPIQVVEFTDYQCPFCQRHALETMPVLIENLVETGRVFYAIKDLPLDQIHPEARLASEAARCAGEQDAYLPMHDAIFDAQQHWSGAGDQANGMFAELAAAIELDVDAFDACLDKGAQAANVQANFEEAISLNVSSTPFFFIDGYAISGAQPYEVFEMAVVLAEQGELDDVMEAQARQIYAELMDLQAAEAAAPPPEPNQPVEIIDVPLGDAYSIGDADAPVTIVEYSDYQCPFCARHALQAFGQIKDELVESGQVQYVFKDLPLTSIHPQATLAAEAARCAGAQDQEAYLAMHDALFENQRSWSGNTGAADLFAGYAAEIGLDGRSFEKCLDNHDFEDLVQADIQEAKDLGITGTPAFVVNGQLLFGAQPYEVFEQAIQMFMAQAPMEPVVN